MCHVLVIEDEWLIAEYMGELAGDAGATSVEYAVTEQDAVALAAERLPDIILSDVHLLEGTGPDAVQTITRRFGDVPVIFVTATPADCRPCAPPGVVLTKPINPSTLMEKFRSLAPV